jgi:hypothetical protein
MEGYGNFPASAVVASQTQSNPVKPSFSTSMPMSSHLAAPALELNLVPPKAVPSNALSVSCALPSKNPACICLSAVNSDSVAALPRRIDLFDAMVHSARNRKSER